MITQTRTLNRTNRRRINHTAVKHAVDKSSGNIRIIALKAESWAGAIESNKLSNSLVNFDLRASGFFIRKTVRSSSEALSDDWAGLSINVPVAYLATGRRMVLRVTVVSKDKTTKGLILASADEIVINEGDGGEYGAEGDNSALSVKFDESLAAELWKLDFHPERGPVLCVNAGLKGGWKDFVRNKVFKFTILPAILRQVFVSIAYAEEEQDWHTQWLSYTAQKGDKPTPPPEVSFPLDRDDYDEVEQWVANSVQKCAVTGRFFKKFLPVWNELRKE